MNMIRHTSPRCFFCGDPVAEADVKLTGFGKVYGPCCIDLFPKVGALNPDWHIKHVGNYKG